MEKNETEKKQKLILVVEDNRDLNELIRFMLNETGYKTACAHTGGDAFRVMKELTPDLVLLDFVLPDIDGVDFFEMISKDETVHGIPVIVVSARNDIQTKLSSFTAGARRYITKPFDANELIGEVDRTLRSLERTKKIKVYKDANESEADAGGDFGHLPAGLEEKM